MLLGTKNAKYVDHRNTYRTGPRIHAFPWTRTSRSKAKQRYNFIYLSVVKALIIVSVLFVHRDGLWKLTDFGLSTDATSKLGRPTLYARGTTSYRAPELLGYHPTVTNKVDIWGLGCVLYQLATSKVAFYDDWEVKSYDTNDSALHIDVVMSSQFL
jgi:hypothetical protein